MAIITAGYDGTVDEVQFAKLLHRYSVVGPDDFSATTQAGDRIVAISDGTALGPGTVDVATGIPPIQFTAATGTRWDLVVLRRDWQPPGGSTSIVIIEGGASQSYPVEGTAVTAWNRRPGIVDDQPLYLQQVNGTLLGTRVDLRCWASHGGLVAVHVDAKKYLETVGTEVLINGVQWNYALGANNVAGWQATPLDRSLNGGDATDITVMRGTWLRAFTTGPRRPRVWSSDGITAHITGLVQYKGSNSEIATIPSAFAPADGSAITHIGAAQASGAGATSGGPSVDYGIEGGVLKVIYQSGTLPTNAFFPLHGSWRISG